MRFFHFLSYHNAVPIALGVLFLGAGGVFAATNPEAIYSIEEMVVSVDNTYIVNKDLSSFTPTVQITEVTEDDELYYVAYRFTTIDLDDYVWKDVVQSETMKVSKANLGPYRDLGLYVMEQLQQKIEREVAYLKEVQGFEKNSVSYKQVATAYSGLVGAMFTDSSETLPGYVPVVVPPPAPVSGNSSGIDSSNGDSNSGGQPGGGPSVAGAPVIQILGNNPAWIPLRSTYADLGAIVTDDKDSNIGIHVFLNEKEVKTIQINTSTTSEYQVVYRATDTDGNIGEAIRTVVVYDSAVESPPVIKPNIPVIPEQNTDNSDDEEGTENVTDDPDTTIQDTTSTTTEPISETETEIGAATSTDSSTAEVEVEETTTEVDTAIGTSTEETSEIVETTTEATTNATTTADTTTDITDSTASTSTPAE